MFISGTFGLVFLRKGLVFWAFLEHDPKPFPFGCACPTEGYFLMGPRQAAAGSGRGRAGRGRECHLRPRTTLPTSPSPHPPPRVPIFLRRSARHRHRRCSLRTPCRVVAGQSGQAGPSYVDALCLFRRQASWTGLLDASCSGQDRRRNWRHQLICTTSYFSMFRHFNFCPTPPPLPSLPCFYGLYCDAKRDKHRYS